MTIELTVLTYGFTVSRTVAADSVEFLMSEGGWAASTCIIHGPERIEIPCRSLSEIHSPSEAMFPVRVTGPDGSTRGQWDFLGATTQIPQGCDVFLYYELENGFWGGVTLAYSRTALVICDYECDPY